MQNNMEIPEGVKKKLLWGIPFAVLIVAYFSGIAVQLLVSLLLLGQEAPPLSMNPVTAWYIAVMTSPGRMAFLAFIGIIGVAVLLSKWHGNKLDPVKFTDDRGVRFAKKNTYGSAQVMQKAEIIKATNDFEIGPAAKVDGYILGRIDPGDEMNIPITDLPAKQTIAVRRNRLGNYNILVVGGSGSGKSAGFVRANILQAIKAGESVVVTDPIGELYTSFYKYFTEILKIPCKVFNLANPAYSDSWACLDEILDPETGDADEMRVSDFSTIIIENTGGVSKDPVHSDGQKNLLSAVIHYLAWDIKQKTSKEYGLLLEELLELEGLHASEVWVNWARRQLSPNCIASTKQKTAIIKKALKASALDKEEKQRLWQSHIDRIPELSLASIYQLLATHNKDTMGNLFDSMPTDNPGLIAYHFYENQNEKLKDSFIGGLGQRLQLWQSRDIRRITRNKDIVLAEAGEKQMVIFVIIPDQTTTTRAISSLFFNFMFKDNAEKADNATDKKRVRINFIMDEFANIGVIPHIDQKINIARGRNLSLCIILQDIKQLDNVYGLNSAPVIIGGCDTILFLGSNNPDTCKFFSALSGEATITVETIRETRGVARVDPLTKEYAQSAGEGKRFVYTEQEIRQKAKEGKCLIWVNGYNVMEAKKFWWFSHPMSRYMGKELPQQKPNEHIPAVIHYQATEHRDAFFDRDIMFEMEAEPEAFSVTRPPSIPVLPEQVQPPPPAIPRQISPQPTDIDPSRPLCPSEPPRPMKDEGPPTGAVQRPQGPSKPINMGVVATASTASSKRRKQRDKPLPAGKIRGLNSATTQGLSGLESALEDDD